MLHDDPASMRGGAALLRSLGSATAFVRYNDPVPRILGSSLAALLELGVAPLLRLLWGQGGRGGSSAGRVTGEWEGVLRQASQYVPDDSTGKASRVHSVTPCAVADAGTRTQSTSKRSSLWVALGMVGARRRSGSCKFVHSHNASHRARLRHAATLGCGGQCAVGWPARAGRLLPQPLATPRLRAPSCATYEGQATYAVSCASLCPS